MSNTREAWILTIGNEIINAVISDTNREAIARGLRAVGIGIRGMSSVGDDPGRIADAVRLAMERAPITIASGGLGPTEDDKTAESIAQLLAVPLESDPEQLARIEERFRTWGRPMSPSNAKQALFPRGAIPIPNDYGTAPGFLIEINGRIAVFFPGVPRELVRMLRERGLPAIAARFGDPAHVFKSRTLHVFGLSESRLGEILSDISKDEPDFHLAFLPRFPIIRLRLDAMAATVDEAEVKLDRKHDAIRELIEENIISDDGLQMEHVTLGLLEERGRSLAVAESITGGLIGEMITRVPGSSRTFMGSIVSYSNRMKTELLGVSTDTLRDHGAVSHECAREMAVGARKAGNADVGLSVTGIAGPDGGTAEKPVGLFFVGLAASSGILTREFFLPGQREWVRTLAAMQTLDTLRRHLLGYRIQGNPS
ncbi:MAG: competence/damage-inducible protein A [Deltaproteobacteria bacterium]|nr:competence/damage-inducible protein A [Deltaproteobacteria bacterium]